MFAWATVKTHFPLAIPITNLFKLLDSSFAEVMSFVKENGNVSSSNNFTLDDKSSDESFV